MSKNKSHKTK